MYKIFKMYLKHGRDVNHEFADDRFFLDL